MMQKFEYIETACGVILGKTAEGEYFTYDTICGSSVDFTSIDTLAPWIEDECFDYTPYITRSLEFNKAEDKEELQHFLDGLKVAYNESGRTKLVDEVWQAEF